MSLEKQLLYLGKDLPDLLDLFDLPDLTSALTCFIRNKSSIKLLIQEDNWQQHWLINGLATSLVFALGKSLVELLKVRADQWITWGLAGYLTNLFLRKMFGYNEYRWHVLQEMEWICAHDNDKPLYWQGYVHPAEVTASSLFRRKAPMVMYLMERRIGSEAFRKVSYLQKLLTSSGVIQHRLSFIRK